MIFSLQMKRSERIGIALALSMGILAGVTGVMKAYHGYILIDVRSPDCKWLQHILRGRKKNPHVWRRDGSLLGILESDRRRSLQAENPDGLEHNKKYGHLTLTWTWALASPPTVGRLLQPGRILDLVSG